MHSILDSGLSSQVLLHYCSVRLWLRIAGGLSRQIKTTQNRSVHEKMVLYRRWSLKVGVLPHRDHIAWSPDPSQLISCGRVEAIVQSRVAWVAARLS